MKTSNKQCNLCQEGTKIEWMVGDGAKHVQRRYESDVQEVQVGW